MHAAAAGHSTLGIPARVGREFVAADRGRSIADLPDHVGRAGLKKSRRGKRGKGKPAGNPHEHHKNVGAALAKGDHAAAKQHAFALVRSLHAAMPSQTPTAGTQTAVPAPPAATGAGNPSRLVMALRRQQAR